MPIYVLNTPIYKSKLELAKERFSFLYSINLDLKIDHIIIIVYCY